MATEQQLLTKLLSGEKLSDTDKQSLADYLEQGDANALRSLLEQRYLEDLAAGAHVHSAVSDQLWQQIVLARKPTGAPVAPPTIAQPAKRRFLAMARIGWAAAAVFLALCAGVYLWHFSLSPVRNTAGHVAQQIQPGHDGAILTLADGSKVQLDTMQNKVVALQGGAIARVVNGALLYEGKSDQPVYNTVSTPKGRQFRLTLSDGTRVWLNSASSIRYPITFSMRDKTRTVAVTGEAYFEVAGMPTQPFVVDVNHQGGVTVLGTSFNLNAYENEAYITTTLLEGKVVVANAMQRVPIGGIAGAVLLPRQQAQVPRPGRPPLQSADISGVKVNKNVDVEKVVAWKNGLFNFENASLAEIMRQLERWYDIEVVYETIVPDIALKGEITRDVPLDDLLKALKKLGVHYRLEGRKLIVVH